MLLTQYSNTVPNFLISNTLNSVHYSWLYVYIGPSGFPTDLSIISVTSTSVTFCWNALECEKQNGFLTGYEYRVHSDTQSITGVVDPEKTTCSVLFSTCGTRRCTVSVAAMNDAGAGEHSPLVEVTIPSTDFINERGSDEPIPTGLRTCKWVSNQKKIAGWYNMCFWMHTRTTILTFTCTKMLHSVNIFNYSLKRQKMDKI